MGMDGWIFHVGNELNQFLRQDKDSFDKSPYVVPRHQPYSWNGFFVVVEAFHEHGGELVCGAIVSVRRGRTVEVQFFLKKNLVNSGNIGLIFLTFYFFWVCVELWDVFVFFPLFQSLKSLDPPVKNPSQATRPRSRASKIALWLTTAKAFSDGRERQTIIGWVAGFSQVYELILNIYIYIFILFFFLVPKDISTKHSEIQVALRVNSTVAFFCPHCVSSKRWDTELRPFLWTFSEDEKKVMAIGREYRNVWTWELPESSRNPPSPK